ncbi:MAG: YvcK family protein [Nitrospirae bacterium]|nr:YvcK family protein [Nitrospirota bacterium]
MKNLLIIGGGTGSYTILKGLKAYSDRYKLTAIVSMMDSGGDTGKLRDEYGILPPGDVRRCLVALSEESDLIKKLFQYRFSSGSLKGKNFGNIFLTALSDITGSDEQAIKETGNILKIKGRVIPVTLDNVDLCAKLEDGSVIHGESNIDIPKHNPELRIKQVFLKPKAKANPDAVDAILNADAIIIGPGDLYTSIIPNFLVAGIPEAVCGCKAEKIYICNLMTKYGETHHLSASEHVKALKKFAKIKCLDNVIVNNGEPSHELLKEYAKEHSFPVSYDVKELYELGVKKVIEADIMNKQVLIRHNPERVAAEVVRIIGM